MALFSGNANKDGKFTNDWIVGHFMSNQNCKTQDVEIKWNHVNTGQKNESLAANKKAKTISILIRGHIRYTFSYEDRKINISLKEEGDYIIFPEGVFHFWVAEKDSLVLTVRWPSLPDDIIRKEFTDEKAHSYDNGPSAS